MVDDKEISDEPVANMPKNNTEKIPAVGAWILLSDVLALCFAFICGGVFAWALRSAFFDKPLQDFFRDVTAEQIVMFFGLGVLSLLWLDSKAHYRQRLPYWEIIGNLMAVAVVGLLMGGFIQFAWNNIYSRLWLFLSWGFFALFLYGGRLITLSLMDRAGLWEIPSLIIGSGPTAKNTVAALEEEKQMGYKIVRVLPADKIKGLDKNGSWRTFLKNFNARFLFLALDGQDLEKFKKEIKMMARDRVAFSIVPPWLGLPLSSLSTHNFVMHDVMLMHDSNRLSLPLSRFLKRSFDISLSGLALIALSPLFVVAALFIKLDGGPAMFSQPRVGRGGKLFPCYKLRTMQVGAEQVLQTYLSQNPDVAAEWEKYQKLKDDPRVTYSGKFLRKISFDEVPQLINVLKGDMSLVGPRPFMSGQEVYYGDDLVSYQSVRPGITGPWQVSGRNSLTFSERVTLEAWYTRNWTLWLDIVIILKTFPAVFKRETVY